VHATVAPTAPPESATAYAAITVARLAARASVDRTILRIICSPIRSVGDLSSFGGGVGLRLEFSCRFSCPDGRRSTDGITSPMLGRITTGSAPTHLSPSAARIDAVTIFGMRWYMRCLPVRSNDAD
jgi:hypothetical protein